MSLNAYAAATALIQAMDQGPQYVRIISGTRAGSIGRVMSVRSKYYSVHDYQLHISGRKPFWVKGNEIEHIHHYEGETCFTRNNDTVVHTDQMGRTLEVGHSIFFQKTIDNKADIVIGTIKRITPSGAVYASIFQSSTNGHAPNQEVRVGRPQSTVIIDKNTVDNVILAKMSSW